jgi:carbon-monoxide dehydrogenase small subunit
MRLRVNGTWRDVSGPANRTLARVLRDDLGLTGTKEACSIGVCGVCSVLVNGTLSSACLLLVPMVNGADITTIEGVAEGERLSPVQEAFIAQAGFQCGICTPGQIIAATALLAETPHPSQDEIRAWMLGNLCRCTGYHGIVASIEAAAETLAREGSR